MEINRYTKRAIDNLNKCEAELQYSAHFVRLEVLLAALGERLGDDVQLLQGQVHGWATLDVRHASQDVFSTQLLQPTENINSLTGGRRGMRPMLCASK